MEKIITKIKKIFNFLKKKKISKLFNFNDLTKFC